MTLAASPLCAAAIEPVWFSTSWRGHWPQLSLEDRLIWARFLDREADHYEAVAYDVAVGGLDCDHTDATETERRTWRYCTAKRIDVLGARRLRMTIFEVRHNAGVSAVGALLCYAVLLAEHNPAAPRAALRLITNDIAPDTRRAAEHYGIAVTVLPG